MWDLSFRFRLEATLRFWAQFIKEKYWEYEYQEVVSPNMYNLELWETSGHAAHYKAGPLLRVYSLKTTILNWEPMRVFVELKYRPTCTTWSGGRPPATLLTIRQAPFFLVFFLKAIDSPHLKT